MTDTARRAFARAQGVVDRAPAGTPVPDVVARVVALQAQDLRAAGLGVRARLERATASSVLRALWEERSLVRMWCMRGTLHLVAAADAWTMRTLFFPAALTRMRRRHSGLGVSTDEALAAARSAVADGPLDREALLSRVLASGVALADDPQTAAHLVGHAALRGVLVETGEREYGLWDDFVGGSAADAEPLSSLAMRYARVHPGAGAEDFAAWSGLGMRACRDAFAGIERPAVAVAAEDPVGVRLLPMFDGYWLGHRRRVGFVVSPEDEPRLFPGGGMLRAAVLHDGRFAGTWRLPGGAVSVDAAGVDVAHDAADVERYLGS